mgnify:CR=1 FL=1
MDKTKIECFNKLYSDNTMWKQNESYSGPGSDLKNTDYLIKNLPLFLEKNNIKSIVDVPCGDFNFMKHIDLKDIKYRGYDISQNCINMCQKYKKDNITFQVLDITNQIIPQVDLVIVKDLFLHLSFQDINKALDNILKSKPKYLAVSKYPQNEKNIDMDTGFGCRVIDITNPPFNINYPIVDRIIYSHNYNGDELIFMQVN